MAGSPTLRMDYALQTHWRLGAPIESVWAALTDVCAWPQWWPYVESVDTLADGAPDGLGAVHRFVWRSRLPYRLVFEMRVTQIERPYRLAGCAHGELDGHGLWTLVPVAGGTGVGYRWEVDLTRPWLRRLAPLARPLYAWNHHQVMAAGGRGLARHLGARLLDCRSGGL